MIDHEQIQGLLALAAAGALTPAEEDRVAAHLRSCAVCSQEMDVWRLIAGDLRRLPTPQPSAQLLQITLARADAHLAEQAERNWNRRVLIFVVSFAWLLTIVSWPLVHLIGGGLLSLLDPRLNSTWISFAGLATAEWLAGGTAAVALALRQRRERRMA
jgi:Putative zinc-finger